MTSAPDSVVAAWRRLRSHVRTLWPRRPLLPAVPFVGWTIVSLVRGPVRWEILVLGLFGLITPYVGPRTKKLYLGLMPAALVAVLYDAMGLVKDVGLDPERIHLCDLREFEIRWFGVTVNGSLTTVHDLLEAHATLPLDLFFSIPYGTFLFAIVLFAVFAYFVDYRAMRRFTWGFLALNVASFVTYHIYPAAPPWYYHAHGCIADLATKASEGPNLARVDAWLGVSYFRSFYGRSSDVFGAVPSLHVAYPLLILLEGWPLFARLRHLKWPLCGFSAFSWYGCAQPPSISITIG